ncbi:MAG: hypothetical protein LC102_03310 [Ignavibacteriales bacterium]|nr:MAG: hypothetical protein F9K26_07375 [Ignavibacteriaceae bacterium]MBW7872930.1 hypothetical protein [Ignavibacteria bacterium]MCZ2142441.1 hypothetical protein [Ignavibacteriales bacterium]OQY72944.1 MAG: hypothetical protein B6D45_08520 [Ignavibacteriales bacterium UTCHB3]MBV6445323.1 hypothetical protein [Ignavibacteriaceae bacterium]
MIKAIVSTLFRNLIKIIAISGVALIVYTVGLYFIYPVSFTAWTSVLPPDVQKNQGLAGLLGAQDFGAILGGAGSASSQLYGEILKSRSTAEYVASKINLTNYYGNIPKVELYEKFTRDLEVEVTKEGIIKIGFTAKTGYFGRDPKDKKAAAEFATLISNTCVLALDSINRHTMHNKAKLTREFIETRLNSTKQELDSAEHALAKFQAEHKTISLPDQLKAAIDAAAKVKSEIITAQIELEYLLKTVSEDAPEVVAAKSKLASLQKEYNKFQTNSDEIFVGFKDAPLLGVQLSDKYREVKVLSEVYLLLQQQYFKEMIQEQKDIPTLEVLDEAIPPIKASSPNMLFSMVTAGLLFFLLTFLYYFKKEDEVKKYLG